ncbi:MAG: insulinase family protein [Oscillospiraceae bacterium]|nr:insulinase family protein [Oscillospiraceae bacterium]
MITKQSLAENFNFYSLPHQQFKTNLLSVYIHVPIERETVTKLALLPAVLERGCEKFPTLADLCKHADELFGAAYDFGLRRKGDCAVLYFSLEFVQSKFAGENIAEQAMELLRQVIFFPRIENEGFLPEYVAQEKENQARFIEGIINDKREYASHRCAEIMFEGEAYGIPQHGYIADLSDVNEKNLYEFYKDIIGNCQTDVFFSGEFDEAAAIAQFKSVFAGEIAPRGRSAAPTAIAQAKNGEPKFVTEDMDVNQSKLNMGFTCECCPTVWEYFPLMMFNAIFGGGPFSKLFMNVRERLSLCYYVGSRVDRLKGIMTVGAGIAPDKYEETKTEILHWLSEMQHGNFSDDEINAAKKYITNGLESMKDSLFVMEDYTLSQSLINQKLPIDEFIANIQRVTKDEIVAAAGKIKLDTIFLLNGKEGGAE